MKNIDLFGSSSNQEAQNKESIDDHNSKRLGSKRPEHLNAARDANQNKRWR
jgi:hypothetical protein